MTSTLCKAWRYYDTWRLDLQHQSYFNFIFIFYYMVNFTCSQEMEGKGRSHLSFWLYWKINLVSIMTAILAMLIPPTSLQQGKQPFAKKKIIIINKKEVGREVRVLSISQSELPYQNKWTFIHVFIHVPFEI